ncbi:Uncharacterised protein [Candidatus Burarchaeum australiense]|nr:Uncharacterised protein [Candidatus Burarchaeum australiense]
MRLFLLLLVFALAVSLLPTPASAAFQQVYHTFDMTLREDGTAHVLEEYELYMDSNESSTFYDSVMSLNDISAWKNVTSIENMRLHMDSKYVDVEDVRIRAQRRQGCNPWTGTCYGIVRMEYEASNLEPGSFMLVEQSKPRTYNYTLNPRALSFETSEAGDVMLPSGTELTINLPPDSLLTRLNPFPEYFTKTDLPISGVSQLKWSGPVVMARFDLGFTREEPLETEVMRFFSDAQHGLADLMRSTEGLVLMLMLLVLLSSLILLRRYMGAQK